MLILVRLQNAVASLLVPSPPPCVTSCSFLGQGETFPSIALITTEAPFRATVQSLFVQFRDLQEFLLWRKKHGSTGRPKQYLMFSVYRKITNQTQKNIVKVSPLLPARTSSEDICCSKWPWLAFSCCQAALKRVENDLQPKQSLAAGSLNAGHEVSLSITHAGRFIMQMVTAVCISNFYISH